MNLFFNDPANPTVAEIDVMIAEKAHRSKGLGSEAVGLMMNYGGWGTLTGCCLGCGGDLGICLWSGISELGVDTFVAKIGQENDKSINMFQRKFGFKEVCTSESISRPSVCLFIEPFVYYIVFQVSRSSVFKEITMEMKVDCEARERVESGAEGAHWVPYRQKN